MLRFYDPQPLEPRAEILLGEFAARHISKVLRKRPGDSLVLFNGDGFDYPAEITHIQKQAVQVTILSRIPNHRESPLQVHLGQGISKGDRMDLAIQKATELGVTEITPLFTSRCDVQLKGERLEKKHHHWQQVAISAAEQSGRARIPVVHVPCSLSDWLPACTRQDSLRLILHPQSASGSPLPPEAHRVTLAIGPEGGFSEEEMTRAQQQGFHSWQLGPRILRTETAPVAALAVLQSLFGDFGHC